MKRKLGNHSMRTESLGNNCSMDEYKVCEILLQLPHLIAVDSLRQCLLKRVTKRRSIMNRRPSIALRSSSLNGNHHGSDDVGVLCKIESQPKVKATASSPDTPLGYLESESDEKPEPPKPTEKRKVPLTKNKEELLQIINELTHNRDSLKGEIQKVRSYHERLQIENVELRARKHQINIGYTLPQPRVKISHPMHEDNHQESPSIKDRTAQIPSLIVFTNKVNSSDLIVPLDESLKMEHSQPSDLKWANDSLNRRAMAASARQDRLQICRAKKYRKVNFPHKQ